MNLLLPCLVSWICLLTVDNLVMPWNAVWWVAWPCKVAIMNLFSSMLCFSSKSETDHIICHVCIDTTILSTHLWLKFIKGVLFFAFSTSMTCLCLPWYVPVACCLLALNIATWCCFWHVSIFTKSVSLISFALSPCYFELVLVSFSRSSVLMICRALCVLHLH